MDWRDPDRECHCHFCDPIPGRERTYDERDRKLLADVERYGWHLVMVPDDPVSRGWVFSVGMWHTLGSPELALFGMDIADAKTALNAIGAAVRGGRPIGPEAVFDDILEGGRLVTFRAADVSWYAPLFGYATWFGQTPPLPIAQVVWAAPDGRWPWSDGIDVTYRRAQPMTWLPAAEHPQGAWSGALAPTPWPFADRPDAAAFTTRRVAFDGAAVIGVTHDTDGSWQFLDGGSTTADDAALVHLAHVVGAHLDVVELADLPPGWEAWRDRPGAPWHRRRSDQED